MLKGGEGHHGHFPAVAGRLGENGRELEGGEKQGRVGFAPQLAAQNSISIYLLRRPQSWGDGASGNLRRDVSHCRWAYKVVKATHKTGKPIFS
jgi:hypothetical protein